MQRNRPFTESNESARIDISTLPDLEIEDEASKRGDDASISGIRGVPAKYESLGPLRPPAVAAPGQMPARSSFEGGCGECGYNFTRGCSGCIQALACDKHRERAELYALDVEHKIRSSGEGTGPCRDCAWHAYNMGFRDFVHCPDHRSNWDIGCIICLAILSCEWHKSTPIEKLGDVQQNVTGFGECGNCLDAARAKGYNYTPPARPTQAAVRDPGQPATSYVGSRLPEF